MPQKKRTTRPCAGRQGSTDRVPGSGTRKRSLSVTSRKPRTADASNETPCPKARLSWEGMMAMFFCAPKISQKTSRTNFTPFSSTNRRTSDTVVSI